MKTKVSKLQPAQIGELAHLEKLLDDEINTSAIPEQKDWSQAKRGAFYRPVKKQLTLRLDADLVDWFRRRAPNGAGYQTKINDALRDYVKAHQGGWEWIFVMRVRTMLEWRVLL